MCTILIEALTPLNRISCIKMYKNTARSRLFCRIAKRSIAIEALTPLNRTSRIKMYKNIARSRLFCRIAKRSIRQTTDEFPSINRTAFLMLSRNLCMQWTQQQILVGVTRSLIHQRVMNSRVLRNSSHWIKHLGMCIILSIVVLLFICHLL